MTQGAPPPRGSIATSHEIVGPVVHREAELEAILRSLPDWFGLEGPLLAFARDTSVHPTFVLEREGRALAFLTLRQHFETSWEVHCMAVAAACRGQGLGTALLAHAEAWAARRGARYLQVKTLAPTHPSPEYAETRAFYARRGFVPLEIFPEIWSHQNPALQLIKTLPAPP